MQEQIIPEEIVLIDEAGEEVRFIHVLTFLYEGERYVALEPAEEAENEEEAEIVLLKIVSEKDQDAYVTIDNEILLNEVFDAFLENMEEMEQEGEKD